MNNKLSLNLGLHSNYYINALQDDLHNILQNYDKFIDDNGERLFDALKDGYYVFTYYYFPDKELDYDYLSRYQQRKEYIPNGITINRFRI